MATYTCRECGAIVESDDEAILVLRLCADCLDYPTDDNSFDMTPID